MRLPRPITILIREQYSSSTFVRQFHYALLINPKFLVQRRIDVSPNIEILLLHYISYYPVPRNSKTISQQLDVFHFSFSKLPNETRTNTEQRKTSFSEKNQRKKRRVYYLIVRSLFLELRYELSCHPNISLLQYVYF